MRVESIDRRKTHFNNSFLEEYIFGNGLDELFAYKPSVDNLKTLVESKPVFSKEIRKDLVSVLSEQYSASGIELSDNQQVKSNIDALIDDDTYTITTGQQIHIGLGPLYVLYKIWNTLTIAKEASKSLPEKTFVPIFWMATEDHDLEEIQTISMFGKEFKWATAQTGAVGRMECTGLVELFEEIESQVNLTSDMQRFVNVCKQGYKLNKLAEAHRFILHSYFGDKGLVVLDADHHKLKNHFSHVVDNELQGINIKGFRDSTEKVIKAGIKPQIHIRDINLFWIEGDKRLRIKNEKEDGFKWSKEVNLKTDLNSISPNVALRPLYQETVLPNLLYVGGPSEIKYWAQLKDVFEINGVQMPIVYPRSNCSIVNENSLLKAGIKDPLDLFKSDDELNTQYAVSLETSELEGLWKEIRAKIVDYEELFHKNLVNSTIEKKTAKVLGAWDRINEIQRQIELSQEGQNSVISRVLALRNRVIDQKLPKERTLPTLIYAHIVSENHFWENSQFGITNSHNVNLLVV